MYNDDMQVISTTAARTRIKEIVNQAHFHGRIFGIGRRKHVEALIIGVPQSYNPNFDEITNINAQSGSFDFLKDEPDLYTLADIKN
jgi:hypothetical protein